MERGWDRTDGTGRRPLLPLQDRVLGTLGLVLDLSLLAHRV